MSGRKPKLRSLEKIGRTISYRLLLSEEEHRQANVLVTTDGEPLSVLVRRWLRSAYAERMKGNDPAAE